MKRYKAFCNKIFNNITKEVKKQGKYIYKCRTGTLFIVRLKKGDSSVYSWSAGCYKEHLVVILLKLPFQIKEQHSHVPATLCSSGTSNLHNKCYVMQYNLSLQSNFYELC